METNYSYEVHLRKEKKKKLTNLSIYYKKFRGQNVLNDFYST